MSKPTTDRGGIQQTIRALKEAGWELHQVADGGDENENVATEPEALDAIMAVDDAYLIVKRGDDTGWVRFVLGNDPEEVICDHTADLSDVLDPLTRSWW